MADLKELGEDVAQAGQYILEQQIGGDASAAFFAASRDDGERALVKLVPIDAPDAEPQLTIWQRTRHLRHPHLLELLDLGRTESAGSAYLYAAFEYPDDNLASAIEHGPISEQETREVLEAALDGLRYLHGQGLVHNAIGPHSIVAVGNTVKLATDFLRESDGLEGHAEDVRQLGELVRTLVWPRDLSEPLATVVRHATEPDPKYRWTLAEIASALSKSKVEPAPLAVAAAAPGPSPVLEPEPPVLDPEPLPTPMVEQQPVLPAPARRAPVEPAAPVGFPRWIFAALAGVLLLILVINLRRRPETPANAAPSAAPATAEPATPQPLPPLPAPSSPAVHPPAGKELAADRTAKTTRASDGAVWRVIAFTYTSHDAAAHRAKRVNERWPELHATVFSPKERRGYYLVALGGRMTRAEATRIQHKARSSGLPRDTYVQNYSN
jgi:hypothetical protein